MNNGSSERPHSSASDTEPSIATPKKVERKSEAEIAMQSKEITGLQYHKDIGLILTTFPGVLKVYDAFDFQQLWVTSNETRKEGEHVTISTMDVSPKLGVLVTAGDAGRLLLLDPFAQGVLACRGTPGKVPILNVYIHESQQQVIAVS
jgi:hypothetical protein